MLRSAAEALGYSTTQGLRAPEGAIGDINVNSQSLGELLIETGAKRREDTLERLNTTAEVKAILTTLEEGFLDLRVLQAGAFAHEVVKEVDGVNALSRVGGLPIQEKLERGEVELAGELHKNLVFVLVAVLPTARLQALLCTLLRLLFVQINFKTQFVSRKSLA